MRKINLINKLKQLFKVKEDKEDLKYLMNKSIQEKRDIYIVSIQDYNRRIEMGKCRQLKIEYDSEYNCAELRTNTGCKFERAFLSSNWLNNKYIEKEVEYDEWYKEDGLGEWHIINENR